MSASDFTQAAKAAPVTIRTHEISLSSLRSVIEAMSRDSIRLNIPKAEQGKATGSVSQMIGWFKKADAEVGTIPGLRKSEVILKFDANLSPPKSVAEWRELEAVIKQVLDTKLTELKPGRTPWIKPAPVTLEESVDTIVGLIIPNVATAESETAPVEASQPIASQDETQLSLLRQRLAGAEVQLEDLQRQHETTVTEITILRGELTAVHSFVDTPLRDLISDILIRKANGAPVPESVLQYAQLIDKNAFNGDVARGIADARRIVPASVLQFNGGQG